MVSQPLLVCLTSWVSQVSGSSTSGKHATGAPNDRVDARGYPGAPTEAGRRGRGRWNQRPCAMGYEENTGFSWIRGVSKADFMSTGHLYTRRKGVKGPAITPPNTGPSNTGATKHAKQQTGGFVTKSAKLFLGDRLGSFMFISKNSLGQLQSLGRCRNRSPLASTNDCVERMDDSLNGEVRNWFYDMSL